MLINSKISEKQMMFIEEYLIDFNGAAAAVRAGYATISARQQAHTILKRKAIREMVEERLAARQQNIDEQCLVSIGYNEFTVLSDQFDSVDELKKWASLTLMRAIQLEGKNLKGCLIKRNLTPSARYAVLYSAGFKCQACGAKPNKDNDVVLQVDHILPVGMGGSDAESNLQVLCFGCNASKSNSFFVNHNKDEGMTNHYCSSDSNTDHCSDIRNHISPTTVVIER